MTDTEKKSNNIYSGIILKGVGGLYEVRLDAFPELNKNSTDRENSENSGASRTVICRARGIFRHSKITPLAGDRVSVLFGASAEMPTGTSVATGTNEKEVKKKKKSGDSSEDSDLVIDSIDERKNFLIRPPLANLDVLFIVIPSAQPSPIIETADKLISIAEHNEIEPVIIITKSDLDPSYASELREIYKKCGFEAFCASSVTDEGMDEILSYIMNLTLSGTSPVAAFAGASGSGKSTLMNHLFPHLKLLTGDISLRIERGKHTTREVSLYPMNELIRNYEAPEKLSGYLADTPGFSMLDFIRYDFFRADQLPFNFREFKPYLGKCKYTKCSHSKEDGCLITEAVKNGDIPKSRHDSYLGIYNALKQVPEWKRKNKDEKQ